VTQRRHEACRRHRRWYHFPDVEKCVLQNQAGDVCFVSGGQTNAYCTSQTLAVDDNLGCLEVVTLTNVIKSSLRVDGDAFLVWSAG